MIIKNKFKGVIVANSNVSFIFKSISDVPWNLQVIPALDNIKKGNKWQS